MKHLVFLMIKMVLIWAVYQLMWDHTLIWRAVNHHFSFLEIAGLILISQFNRARLSEGKK